ncbi:S24 family peptidase, partial [Pseudorhodobacter sp.]
SGRQASIAAIGNDGLVRDIKAGRLPGIDRLEALFNLLDIELYIGPRREMVDAIQPPDADLSELANIPLYNADLAAGGGATNGEEEIAGYLAFRRDWLRKVGVAPSSAVMARVEGESMLPTIWSGDMVLIDTSKIEIHSRGRARKTSKPHVYAFVEDGSARVKRIERVETDFYAVISDNPEFPIEFKSQKALDDMHIIGRVMWWAHTDQG